MEKSKSQKRYRLISILSLANLISYLASFSFVLFTKNLFDIKYVIALSILFTIFDNLLRGATWENIIANFFISIILFLVLFNVTMFESLQMCILNIVVSYIITAIIIFVFTFIYVLKGNKTEDILSILGAYDPEKKKD